MSRKPKTVVPDTTTETNETVTAETVQQVETTAEQAPETETVTEVNVESVPQAEVIEEQKPKIETAPEENNGTDIAEKDECIYCGEVCETADFYVNDKPFCCAEHAALYADVMKGR